jgi:hypothetical protein
MTVNGLRVHSITERMRRCPVLDTVDDVFTHERLKVREWKGEPAREVTPKRDGWWLNCFQQPRDSGNGLCVFGRTIKPEKELSHFLEVYDWYRLLADSLPPLSSVVGELWVPGERASAVVTHMHVQSRDLRFMPFAVPRWNSRDCALESTVWRDDVLVGLGLEPPPHVERMNEGPTELMMLAHHWDAEGVVLKDKNYAGWYKLKEERTADLVCTAVKMGDTDGKYIGQCGSLHGSWYDAEGRLVEVACVSGMDDVTRAEITQADVGRCFECAFQYVGAGGRLRHPRFIRWRDDKPAKECVQP